MPLADFTNKDQYGRPTIITGFEDVEIVPTPADWEPDQEEFTEALAAPVPQVDCANMPDGRYGIDKIIAWFEAGGITVPEGTSKDILVAQAKELCKNQETA